MAGPTHPPTLQTKLTDAWTHRGLLAWLLWPISILFGTLVAIRRVLFRAAWFKTQQVPVVVVVVGNVVAGGSGKTPVVIALVRHLQACGLHPGVISRGYGRATKDCREVLANSAISEVGDEPALIRCTTLTPVFVANSRFDAASQLLARYPATNVIVCDDGLQHLGLHRDLEICVFDDRGIGNGWLIPAGPLREPWPRPADLVLHTGARPAFVGFTSQRTLAPYALRSDGHQIELSALAGSSSKPLLAVAGIAKPEEFFAMLRAQGLRLARTLALADHFDFEDWNPKAYEEYDLVCTEKDAVKLWHKQPEALAVPLLFTPEPAFIEAFDALLATRLNATLSFPHGHTTS